MADDNVITDIDTDTEENANSDAKDTNSGVRTIRQLTRIDDLLEREIDRERPITQDILNLVRAKTTLLLVAPPERPGEENDD